MYELSYTIIEIGLLQEIIRDFCYTFEDTVREFRKGRYL